VLAVSDSMSSFAPADSPIDYYMGCPGDGLIMQGCGLKTKKTN
jgi:hypothetical protein